MPAEEHAHHGYKMMGAPRCWGFFFGFWGGVFGFFGVFFFLVLVFGESVKYCVNPRGVFPGKKGEARL